MSGSSSYRSESDDEDYDDGAGPGRRFDIPHSALTEVHDYAQAYAPLDADVLGDDSSDPDDDDLFLDAAISGKKGPRGGACSLPAAACSPPATVPIRLRRCREPAARPRSRSQRVRAPAERDGETRETSYMLFDFRHGPDQWPEVRHAAGLRPWARDNAHSHARLCEPEAQDRRRTRAALRVYWPPAACVGRDCRANAR